MRLRFYGDDRPMLGKDALECLQFHCHGDHSPEGRRGDVDGVMNRIADTFKLDETFKSCTTLEERAVMFVMTAINAGLIVFEKG